MHWPQPCGEIRFTGRRSRVADGWQELTGKLSRRDVEARDGDRDFLRVERHYLDHALRGSMTVRRQFDPQGGVRQFRWSIDVDTAHFDGGKLAPLQLTGSCVDVFG